MTTDTGKPSAYPGDGVTAAAAAAATAAANMSTPPVASPASRRSPSVMARPAAGGERWSGAAGAGLVVPQQADDITKVLWKDKYTVDNPFAFEELSAYLGFPGDSWGYWPEGLGVDLSKCSPCTSTGMRAFLVSIKCPVHDLKTAQDYATRLSAVLDLQFNIKDTALVAMEHEASLLQNEIRKYKELLASSENMTKALEVSTAFEDLKTAHHFLAEEVKNMAYEQRRAVKRTAVQINDYIEEWSDAMTNRADPRTGVLETRLSSVTSCVLACVDYIKDILSEVQSSDLLSSSGGAFGCVPPDLQGSHEDLVDMMQRKIELALTVLEADGVAVTAAEQKEAMESKILSDYVALHGADNLKHINDRDLGHFKAGEELLMLCGKVSGLKDAKDQADSSRNQVERELVVIRHNCDTLQEQIEQLHEDMSKMNVISDTTIHNTLTRVAEYLDERTAQGSQKTQVPRQVHQRLHELNEAYSLILEEKRELELTSRRLLEQTWSFLRPQDAFARGPGGPVADVACGPDTVYTEPDKTQRAAQGLVQLVQNDAKRLNKLNNKMKQIRQMQSNKWAAIVETAGQSDGRASTNGLGTALLPPPRREASGMGVLKALQRFIEDQKREEQEAACHPGGGEVLLGEGLPPARPAAPPALARVPVSLMKQKTVKALPLPFGVPALNSSAPQRGGPSLAERMRMRGVVQSSPVKGGWKGGGDALKNVAEGAMHLQGSQMVSSGFLDPSKHRHNHTM